MQSADEFPLLQDRIQVIGYPTGGKTLCVTQGIVSRIDLVHLSGHPESIVVIQIDAAINSGNSGGPVLDTTGRVTGVPVASYSHRDADNIGYILPAGTVRAFLGRCRLQTTTAAALADKASITTESDTIDQKNDQAIDSVPATTHSYAFEPSIPCMWHTLENQSLRLYHKVPEPVHDILLTSVSDTVQPALQINDVLTKINGHANADDGQVELRGGGELINHRYFLKHGNTQAVIFTVYRNGQEMTMDACQLSYIPQISAFWGDVDHLPNYLIVGALVFLPLSYNIMSKTKRTGSNLRAAYKTWNRKWKQDWDGKTEFVLLADILVHEFSFSYERGWRRAAAFNDVPLQSLAHLAELWQESCRRHAESPTEHSFARIALEHDDDIVLEVGATLKAQDEIL